MTENKKEDTLQLKLQDSFDSNLIPAVVPDNIRSRSPHVISEQPRRYSSMPDNGRDSSTELKGSIQHYNRRNPQSQLSKNPEGLARLGVAEQVEISVEQPCLSCIKSETKYFVRDSSKGSSEESLIFQGSQGQSALCVGSIGDLRNVVIRDREQLPVARVCFKEKHILLESLVLAVYCPPEQLVGTIEQSPSCFVFPKEFMLGNQNGDQEFRISYEGGHFSVTSLQNQNDTNHKAAHILGKSSNSIRVQFASKMSLNSKLILIGFCIGVVTKRMSQEFIRSPS